MGLQSAPHALIGVPWEDLCCVVSKDVGESGAASSPTSG